MNRSATPRATSWFGPSPSGSRRACRDNVVIGHIGAGEFAVLYPGRLFQHVDGRHRRTADRAELMEPYDLMAHQQSVSVSAGIVAMPKDGVDPVLAPAGARTWRCRDCARRRHRRAGPCSIPDIGKVADYRQWSRGGAQHRLRARRFRPALSAADQPDEGRDRRLRGADPLEATPSAALIAPIEFISIAEETGLIGPDRRMGAARRPAATRSTCPSDCFVAVNISTVQFMTKDFVGLVCDVIRETGIKPQRLELELPETAMMQDRDRAAAMLKQLTEMGITVAVDDFGTGYSNLSYLIDFSFHKLKIDRSFVSRLDTDANSGAVVSTIVGLSRALGVHAIAEGVETESRATCSGCRLRRVSGSSSSAVQLRSGWRTAPCAGRRRGTPAPALFIRTENRVPLSRSGSPPALQLKLLHRTLLPLRGLNVGI